MQCLHSRASRYANGRCGEAVRPSHIWWLAFSGANCCLLVRLDCGAVPQQQAPIQVQYIALHCRRTHGKSDDGIGYDAASTEEYASLSPRHNTARRHILCVARAGLPAESESQSASIYQADTAHAVAATTIDLRKGKSVRWSALDCCALYRMIHHIKGKPATAASGLLAGCLPGWTPLSGESSASANRRSKRH